MKCPKCENLMISEEFSDYKQTGKVRFIGWRCISCGLILDPTILLNRGRKLEQSGGGRRSREKVKV